MISKPIFMAFIIIVTIFIAGLILYFHHQVNLAIQYINIDDEKKLLEMALSYSREIYNHTREREKREQIRRDFEWLNTRQAYIWLFDQFEGKIKGRMLVNSLILAVVFFAVIFMLFYLIVRQYSKPLECLIKSLKIYTADKKIATVTVKGSSKMRKILRDFNGVMQSLAEKIFTENLTYSIENWQSSAQIIIHEIKNKLTPLKLDIDLALEGASGRMNANLHGIKEKIQKIDLLVYRFRDIAALSAPSPKQIDLKSLLQKIVHGEKLADHVLIDAQFHDFHYYADPLYLEIILVNLIKNGLESYDSREVRWQAVVNISCLHRIIEIRDRGCGIAPHCAGKIFKPCFSTKQGGNGMGLFISKELCRLMGIAIDLRSEPGKGSSFYLDFNDEKN